MTRRGTAKLLDFGLAKVAPAEAERAPTSPLRLNPDSSAIWGPANRWYTFVASGFSRTSTTRAYGLVADSSSDAQVAAALLKRHRGKGKPPYQLTHFTDARRIADFAWSRDGKRLAIARATVTNDIVLFKGLKK